MTSRERLGVAVAILVTGIVCYNVGRRPRTPDVASYADQLPGAPATEGTHDASADAQADKWQVTEGKSPMDDSPTQTMSIDADLPFTAWPGESHTPTLVIRCRERKTDVFIINGAQPNVEYDRTDEATVRFRFDERPAYSEVWGEGTSNDSLFSPNPIAFARKLSKARKLTYQFTPFSSSAILTTFTLAGIEKHLPEVAKACGWSSK